jgi:RHS repeat-associated protein
MTARGSDTLRWDSLGRLKSATASGKTVCYTYAPDGSLKTRVYDSTGSSACTTATTTTNYLLGDLYETNAAGTTTTSYVDGPAGDLAAFDGPPTTTSTVSYLYYNGHGDLAAEASSTGTATATHTYDAWGSPNDTPPADATSHRFTGRWNKQYDSTTSLVLMGARPYDPALGRFLAVDPVDGGSLNNYDYAAQDPLNGYDLGGTTRCDDAGAWAGCGGNTHAKNSSIVVPAPTPVPRPGVGVGVGVGVGIVAIGVATSTGGQGENAASAFLHYTTAAGQAGIEASGTIRPGVDGRVYVTPTMYLTGAQAQTSLSLRATPTGYFVIPMSRLPGLQGPSTVTPHWGQPGGGTEYWVTTAVNAVGLRWVPIE